MLDDRFRTISAGVQLIVGQQLQYFMYSYTRALLCCCAKCTDLKLLRVEKAEKCLDVMRVDDDMVYGRNYISSKRSTLLVILRL